MKYTYKVLLDKRADMWNWLDAAQYSEAYGYNWRDNLRSDDDRKIFDKISKLPKKDARAILSPYLDKLYKNNKYDIDRYTEYLNKVYSLKINEACELLEKLTGKKSYFKKFTILITTFPRSPYDADDGSLYMKLNSEGPVATFMHEALHFQLHNYWRKDTKSPISKLSENDFHYLKECLTVVLDNDLVPFIEIYDHGYPSHQDFRKILHKHWQKYHDFDKLIDYGLKQLPKYSR
jgi:hypothetical protein